VTKPRSREAGSVSSAHADSGLWPLLLGSPPYNACPWTTGEFFPAMMSSPDDHDPAAYLADQWRDYADVSVTAPFGARWPGLAEPPATVGTPDEAAGDLAEHLLADSAVLHDWEDRFGARVVGWSGRRYSRSVPPTHRPRSNKPCGSPRSISRSARTTSGKAQARSRLTPSSSSACRRGRSGGIEAQTGPSTSTAALSARKPLARTNWAE